MSLSSAVLGQHRKNFHYKDRYTILRLNKQYTVNMSGLRIRTSTELCNLNTILFIFWTIVRIPVPGVGGNAVAGGSIKEEEECFSMPAKACNKA
jgi:hypothetical protein